MKKLVSFLASLLFIVPLQAQGGITGRYKLVEGKFETVKGKFIDFLKEEYDKDPCLANVIFDFTNDGKIITTADGCPDSTKKKLFGPELAVKWQVGAQNKMIISTKDDEIDPMAFDLLLYLNRGKKEMKWEVVLEIDPNDPNPEKAKKLIYVYRAY